MSWLDPTIPEGGYVLASASPRRAQILAMLGFEFRVQPTNVEDDFTALESSEMHVEELAKLKAAAVTRRPGEISIGADTVVELEGEILEKPGSEEDAFRMLSRLNKRWHTVHTGVALEGDQGRAAGVESTRVRFNDLDDAFLRRYVATGEPLDKAGGYGIQGIGSLLVAGVEGCFYNVMGFPVTRYMRLLKELVKGG